MPRAFTLVEVLVTMALSVILLLTIVQLYIMYGRLITFHQTSIGITLDGSSIMDATRTNGAQAESVVAAHSFSGVNYDSGATTAIFKLPSLDATGAIIDGAYDYVGIYASGESAYRLIDAAPGSVRVSGQKRLSGMLDALSFAYDSPVFSSVTSVTIDATTSVMIRGEAVRTHLRERIYLKNI